MTFSKIVLPPFSFLFPQSEKTIAQVGSWRRLTGRRHSNAREGIGGSGSVPLGSAMIVQDDIGLEQTVWPSMVDAFQGD